jgi:hypothetical protein
VLVSNHTESGDILTALRAQPENGNGSAQQHWRAIMSSATEHYDVTSPDGRVLRITIDRRELASTLLFRLNKTRHTASKGYAKPQKIVALEGGVKAEWLPSISQKATS